MSETLEEQLKSIEERKKVLNVKIEEETKRVNDFISTHNPLLSMIFEELYSYGVVFKYNGNKAEALMRDDIRYILINNLDNVILINVDNHEIRFNHVTIVSGEKIILNENINDLIKIIDEIVNINIL